MSKPSICVVGGGFVGLTTAIVLAQHGHPVSLVEASPERRSALAAAKVPFFEPGLAEALATELAQGRLTIASDPTKALATSEIVFLCVGTPSGADGSVDLTFVERAAGDVGRALRDRAGYQVVVVKSTVPPGTLEDVVVPAIARASGKPPGDAWGAASNPEFLKEGAALRDAQEPDRIVVGATDARAEAAMRALYADAKCPQVFSNPRTAEMIKYTANSFLAVKIAFANEMANLSEKVGVDWYDVVAGIGPDPRIGPHFLRPGVGFGGSCFPKDLAAIQHVGREAATPLTLVDAALHHNEVQPLRVVEMLKEELGELRGKRIALLGLAFKPDTDDVRETRALPIWRALRERGAEVVCHDPMAMETFRTLAPEASFAKTVEEALRGADAAVLQTEWAEYRALTPAQIASWMHAAVLVDGRRCFEREAFDGTRVRYRAVGLGR